jgi:hypothetical protein
MFAPLNRALDDQSRAFEQALALIAESNARAAAAHADFIAKSEECRRDLREALK